MPKSATYWNTEHWKVLASSKNAMQSFISSLLLSLGYYPIHIKFKFSKRRRMQ